MSGDRRWRGGLAVPAAAALLCLPVLAGCDAGTSSTDATPTTAAQPQPTPAPVTAQPASAPVSSAAATASPSATAARGNPVFPLAAGLQTTRQGFVNKGSRRLPHRQVFTITDVVKDVDGVRAVVALDQDFDGGELAEQSLELVALDSAQSVRYVGSYTETYEGGQFVNATDAWLSGVKGGRSGILVPGAPTAGSATFRQALVPGEGEATAKVVKTGTKKCVPFRCFSDVVVIEEDRSELKYYAPGVGGIVTEPLSGSAQETEELINVTSLSKRGLAEISAECVALDRHARTVAADVYGASAPARRTSGG